MQYQDQVIDYSHGDKIVCGSHGKLSFFFRAGPVPKYNSIACWCCCAQTYSRGHQGKVQRTFGNYRSPRWIRTFKLEYNAKREGFKVRKGMKYYTGPISPWLDDNPPRHVEKSWKLHRDHQWH